MKEEIRKKKLKDGIIFIEWFLKVKFDQNIDNF